MGNSNGKPVVFTDQGKPLVHVSLSCAHPPVAYWPDGRRSVLVLSVNCCA